MIGYAPGSLLAQLQDLSASAQLAYSAVHQTEVQHIVIANTTATAAKFSIYHDDNAGNGYSAGTALFLSVGVDGNNSTLISADDYGTGITIAAGGSIGIKSDTTAALTFSVYGTTRAGR